MSCITLITRPGRAAFAVAFVGLLFGLQGAIVLRWPQSAHGWGVAGYASEGLLAAALVAAMVALGVLAPLHSRRGALGLWMARSGVGLMLAPVAVGLLLGRDLHWPVLYVGLGLALAGMRTLVVARRQEGDLPEWFLQVPLFATAAGMLLVDRGGCLVLAAAWLAVAVALWTEYASPSRIAPAS
ncbi:MAG: hypothetical protein ACXWZP_10120 [Gaiellaceae bacterium]